MRSNEGEKIFNCEKKKKIRYGYNPSAKKKNANVKT